MKTICAALGMAALLTFSASADTLTLPKGQVLDFGDTVDVLDGSQTYFGKQMKDWAEHEKVEKTSKRQAAAGIIGSVDSPAAVYLESKLTPDVSRLAAKAGKNCGYTSFAQIRRKLSMNPSCSPFPWIIRIPGKRKTVYCPL